MKLKLAIETIPEGSWGKSLANLLPRPVWDTLRREIYTRARYRCSICEEVNEQLHCHEVWKYDDRGRVQTLVGFRCLCSSCHMVKHWGRTVAETLAGNLPQDTIGRLTKHFCEVNQCTVGGFEAHKVLMGAIWQKRSRHHYKVDFGLFKPEVVVKEWKNLKK